MNDTLDTPGVGDGDVPQGKLIVHCLANMPAEEIAWLWPGRIATGKVSLIGGMPGVRKSWLCMYLAAAVSRGAAWADGRGCAPMGSVLIAAAEDGAQDTIRPRLLEMDADCRRVHVVSRLRMHNANGDLVDRGFTLADLPHLAQAIQRLEDCRLVIIDPISAFLAQVGRNRRQDGRTVMSGLATVADHLHVAMVLVTHLSKMERNMSIHRMIGSVGVAGSARSVWLVARDRRNPQRRLMALAKCNMTADETGLAWRMAGGRLVFERKPLRMSADELLAAMKPEGRGADAGQRGAQPIARRKATEWLRKVLAGGAMPAGAVGEQADAAGLSWRTVQRAANGAGVIRQQVERAGWQWRLPGDGQK